LLSWARKKRKESYDKAKDLEKGFNGSIKGTGISWYVPDKFPSYVEIKIGDAPQGQ